MAFDSNYQWVPDYPYADFGMPGSTVNQPAPSPAPTTTSTAGTSTGTQGSTDFTEQHTDENAAGYSPYADQDWSAVQSQLQQEAASRGLAYDPSDLADIQRAYYNTGPTGGQGGNLQTAIAAAISKYDSRLVDGGGSTGSTGTSSGSWFGSNAPGGTSTGTGFPQIAPYGGGDYSTLDRPSWLQGPYTPPTWGVLSLAELQATPGYQSRLDAGMQTRERSAAAQGSILSGGTQKALERYGQDFASNEYAQEYARRYGAFIDSANLGQQGRLINENAYQSDVGNNRNQYLTRYQQYLDTISNQRNADNDLWSRNQDLVRNSLDAAALAR